MRYVSIDPGKNRVAWAKWSESGALISAGLAVESPSTDCRVEHWRKMAETTNIYTGIDSGQWTELIVEIPQIYGKGQEEKDPNDLIDLAGVVGAIASKICYGKVIWSPVPREWKGQLPKVISVKRVEEKLSDDEKKLIVWPSKSLKHNVYDALHLGLTYLSKKGLR
jgi:hypothetical protein